VLNLHSDDFVEQFVEISL